MDCGADKVQGLSPLEVTVPWGGGASWKCTAREGTAVQMAFPWRLRAPLPQTLKALVAITPTHSAHTQMRTLEKTSPRVKRHLACDSSGSNKATHSELGDCQKHFLEEARTQTLS